MHVSAKADYAVRALVELPALTADQPGNVTVEQMCRRQGPAEVAAPTESEAAWHRR